MRRSSFFGWVAVAPLVALLAACGGGSVDTRGAPPLVDEHRLLMGTGFRIKVSAADAAAAREAIGAAFDEVARVEALLSEWQETSEISEVNREAGVRPVAVGPELFEVLDRSLGLSAVTGGAFDVTFASCGGLWSFREPRIPGREELDACLANVDFRRLRLDPTQHTVFLPTAGMRIGIAGIGKGYGVDRAAEVLEERGFHDYIVDGGGDIRLAGSRGERPWRAGIADPRQRGELYAAVSPAAGAIVTSGDYEQGFDRDGVRYHHILDPASGLPARRSVAVTVIAPNATDADALATGLFVLGPERGLALVETLPGVEALFFGPDLQVQVSSGFPPLERDTQADH